MSKKTTISINNLTINNTLSPSFYQGARVNLAEVGLFNDEDDDEDEMCHCCDCENERREKAEEDDESGVCHCIGCDNDCCDEDECPCESCNQECDKDYTPGCPECDQERADAGREIRQNAHIISQGVALFRLKEEFSKFKEDVTSDLKNLVEQVNVNTRSIDSLINTNLDETGVSQSDEIKTMVINNLKAELIKEQAKAEEFRKKYLREDNPVKPGTPISKMQEEKKVSGKLTEKHIQEMAKHKVPKAKDNLEELTEAKKSKYFKDTDRNK